MGGGFGGLAAANELRSSLPDAKITIVDKKDYFMMDLVKLWIIKGSRQFETSKRPLQSVTKKGINFVNEQVTAIDTQQKIVKTTTRELSYDYLIVAMGVELAPEKIPGLAANGMILYDLEHVPKIREKILQMKRKTSPKDGSINRNCTAHSSIGFMILGKRWRNSSMSAEFTALKKN